MFIIWKDPLANHTVSSHTAIPLGKPSPQVSPLPPGGATSRNSLPQPLDTSARAIVYFFLDSEPQLGKSKELNNQGMKVLLKRTFKNYFLLSPQKIKEIRQALYKIFHHSPIEVCRGASICRFKINALFLWPSLLRRISQALVSDQQNGKPTKSVDYHPSPSVLISRMLPLVFL